jgi:hypothetical protein
MFAFTAWFFWLLAVVLVALLIWFRRTCWSWLCKWSEVLTIPAGIGLWSVSDDLLRLADPTAGTFDAGVFQLILFSIIGFLVLHGFTRVFMKLQWPTLDGYLDTQFNKEFFNPTVTPWQRLKLSSAVFFALFFALLLLTRVL